MNIDLAAFFTEIRKTLYNGKMQQEDVEGVEAMLSAAPANMPLDQVAYCLATAFHETGGDMQPVTENLNYTTAQRIHDVWPSRLTVAQAAAYVRQPEKLANAVYASRMGNLLPGDGWKFRGRGLVQITGRSNYVWGSKETGVDLLEDPEKANDPKIAARLLYAGMAGGHFTGKKLAQYFDGTNRQPTAARAIVNPDSNGALITTYYTKFLAALQAAASLPTATPLPEKTPEPGTLPVRTYLMIVLEDGKHVETFHATREGVRIT